MSLEANQTVENVEIVVAPEPAREALWAAIAGKPMIFPSRVDQVQGLSEALAAVVPKRQLLHVTDKVDGDSIEHALNSLNLTIQTDDEFVTATPLDATHIQLSIPASESYTGPVLLTVNPA